MSTLSKAAWEFIWKVEPSVTAHECLEIMGMQYWLAWNRKCQEVRSCTHAVERLDVRRLLNSIGQEHRRECTIDHIATDANSRTHSPYYKTVSWKQLRLADEPLFKETFHLAKQYGY